MDSETTGSHPGHLLDCDPDLRARLAEMVEHSDLDAAIEAGLMAYKADPARPCPACAAADPSLSETELHLLQARQSLLDAWAARDRHRAREQRQARRDATRLARRQASNSTSSGLPDAAAAILARAKSRAAGNP